MKRNPSFRLMSSSLFAPALAPALALALPVALLGFAAPAARAQPAAPSAAPATAVPKPASAPPGNTEGQQGPAVRVEKGANGKTVYRITEAIRIDGKIQKPEAFYVLQKSSINYDWQDLKQDFVPKIVDSVSKSPF